MMTEIEFKDFIASVPDFPKKGIMFRDVSPLIEDGIAYDAATDKLTEFARAQGAEVVCGPEARGFLVGCPVASKLKVGFVPARKAGKLPRKTISVSYGLEYGDAELFMHEDSIKAGQKVLIVDDLLATGGTVKATIDLVEKLGGVVVGVAFLIELSDLKGRQLIGDYPFYSLMTYSGE